MYKGYKNKSQRWICESFPVTDNNETIYGKEIAFIKGRSVTREGWERDKNVGANTDESMNPWYKS